MTVSSDSQELGPGQPKSRMLTLPRNGIVGSQRGGKYLISTKQTRSKAFHELQIRTTW